MDEKYMEMAAELERATIVAGIEKARKQQLRPDGFDGFCDCGEQVPPGRVNLGFFNCLACQQKHEGRQRFYRDK
jgi:RNA polymerase-binding transcription factor DksA